MGARWWATEVRAGGGATEARPWAKARVRAAGGAGAKAAEGEQDLCCEGRLLCTVLPLALGQAPLPERRLRRLRLARRTHRLRHRLLRGHTC